MVVLVEYKITMDDLPSYMKIKKFSCQQENMMTLAEVEKQHILKVLDFVGNNKTKAAEILGIDRKTLRSKLK
jgi:two-component system response regulator HydG